MILTPLTSRLNADDCPNATGNKNDGYGQDEVYPSKYTFVMSNASFGLFRRYDTVAKHGPVSRFTTGVQVHFVTETARLVA